MEEAVESRGSGTALWLALVWMALIVHVSLYPFGGWRSTGVPWYEFLEYAFPRYWTWGDLIRNVLGYVPLGLLLALGNRPWQGRYLSVILRVGLTGTALSLLMEILQNWLPGRVASNVDLGLNSLGTLLGGGLAFALVRLGVVWQGWERLRQRWGVVEDDPVGEALILTWPLVLLYPLPVAFGVGQVLERLELLAERWLAGTPFLAWLPVRAIELQPMQPLVEALLVALGLCIPVWMAYGLVRERRGRLMVWAVYVVIALSLTALTWHMVFGPGQAWTWLWPPVRLGVLGGCLLGLLAIGLPRKVCQGLALAALLALLYGLNDAAIPIYHDLAMQERRLGVWYGLMPWLGWVWPFVAVGYLAVRLVYKPPMSGQ